MVEGQSKRPKFSGVTSVFGYIGFLGSVIAVVAVYAELNDTRARVRELERANAALSEEASNAEGRSSLVAEQLQQLTGLSEVEQESFLRCRERYAELAQSEATATSNNTELRSESLTEKGC
jgi:hypothetical protein